MNNPQDIHHPILVLIRGLPGSGKSYLAAALQKSLGQDSVVTLDPDAIDYASKAYIAHTTALTAEGVDVKFHPYRFLRSKACAAITDHKSIIWNQAFTLLDGFKRTTTYLQAFAAQHNIQLPILVVEVTITEAAAKARVTMRETQSGHGVSEEAFARFIHDYKSFANEGYNTVTVNGEDAISASVATVRKALETL
jgi:adenylate kinase family enzyme